MAREYRSAIIYAVAPPDGRDARHHGQDRRAVQAAGLHLPLLGDLRRPRLDVRLRPLRRPAEDQRQERVVARDAPGARRHRRPGLGDPPAPARLGGQRPPRRLHRPDGRLPRLRPALPRRPPRPGSPCPRKPSKHPGEATGLRPHRGARLQPHVRDDDRPGEGLGRDGLPAPRDRAGHLRELQERPAVRAQEAAVRHRPDRQVVSQRDHARQLHLPHARVRADGDGVLRPARRGAALVSSTGGRRAATGTLELGPARRPPAPARARPRRAVATTRAAPPTSSTCSRSAGPSSRASPTAATSTSPSTPSSPARSSSTSTSRRASATSRTSSSRPPAPTARRSRSSSTPTTRRRSTASSARSCSCTRAWRP